MTPIIASLAKPRQRATNSTADPIPKFYCTSTEKDEALVHDLRGMFDFTLWDNERRKLFLARDPYGIKPLCYADDGWTFRFASQVKALFACNNISRGPKSAAKSASVSLATYPSPS
jgi:asparagine synthase (glutamine-hydrolysing)